MFKLLCDNFVINEIAGSSSTEALLGNEIYISDDMPSIEKIISTEGKVKITDASVLTNKVTVYGDLTYNIIYRSNDEEVSVYSTSSKIDFMEEIPVQGATEKMTADVCAYLDYIDSEIISDKKFLVKAVVNIDASLINNRSLDFISNLESDGTFQAKTKNIVYTDIVHSSKDNLIVSETIELSDSYNEISTILKADADAYITNVDILNDRMLVEGICRVGFLYAENNNLSSVCFISEDFPFTHYVEVSNSSEDMLREIDIIFKDLKYDVEQNYDKEDKIINFTANFLIETKLYDTVEKNVITDCYSTSSKIEVESADVGLVSTKDIKNSVVKYENNFDVISGTIKDIYTIDISPKISEKRVYDDKYIIDGFFDVNLLYLNGDVNKIDRAYASMPFSTTFILDDEYNNCDISSNLKVKRCSAYRKGSSAVVVNCDIDTSLKFKNSDNISVISNITEAGPLNYSLMPSLIFRVVQPGETLWDIAKNYNVSINDLNELNDFSIDDDLPVGKKIIIARKA